jgi:hypothetical protein
LKIKVLFYLVENTDQLHSFYDKGYKKAFVEVIPYNDLVHPILNQVSLLYIKPITDSDEKGYMLSINHNETLPVNIKHINQILKQFDEIYVRDKKTFLYYFQIKHAIDICLSSPPYIHPTTPVHEHFYNTYSSRLDINRIIPIVKHYEKCEHIYKHIKDYIRPYDNKHFDKLIYSLFYIEKNGIKIDKDLFKQYLKPNNESFNIRDNKIYTHYNLHTTTGRPSNAFNNINFAALNKDNGCRMAFIPENDKFIEIDISAYHPTLASQLVGYKFSKPIYEELAQYANVDVKDAKELMFKQLYGGIYNDYKDWEFFIKIQDYIDQTWLQFEEQGYIQVPNSSKTFYKNELENMNPQKLFNYILQNLEASNNSRIIWDIIKILKDKNTKIVLYTYDALLFDWDEDEQDVIEAINAIFKKYNLKTKHSYGTSYDFA